MPRSSKCRDPQHRPTDLSDSLVFQGIDVHEEGRVDSIGNTGHFHEQPFCRAAATFRCSAPDSDGRGEARHVTANGRERSGAIAVCGRGLPLLPRAIFMRRPRLEDVTLRDYCYPMMQT